MIDEFPPRISLPQLLLYLLTAVLLVALCGGAVILLKGWLFGVSPPLVEGQSFPLEAWLAYVALAVAVLIAYGLQGRFVEHRTRPELAPGRAGEALVGAALGIGFALLVVLVLWLGGAYRIRFRTLDGREHEACGEFLEVVPPRRIVMSWSWAFGGVFDEEGRTSRIEFDLVPIAEGTELTFTHAGLANEASAQSHTGGWTGALDKLDRRLERENT